MMGTVRTATGAVLLMAGLLVGVIASAATAQAGEAPEDEAPEVLREFVFEGRGWWIVNGTLGDNYPDAPGHVEPGARVPMETWPVPEEDRDVECLVDLVTTNNSSVHDTTVVVESGDGVLEARPEAEPDEEAGRRLGELTLGEAVTVSVDLGAGDTFSAGLRLVLSDCGPTEEPHEDVSEEPTEEPTQEPTPTGPSEEPTSEPTAQDVGGSAPEEEAPVRDAGDTRGLPEQETSQPEERDRPRAEELPRTGLPAPLLGGLAALLLGSGGLLLRRSR